MIDLIFVAKFLTILQNYKKKNKIFGLPKFFSK